MLFSAELPWCLVFVQKSNFQEKFQKILQKSYFTRRPTKPEDETTTLLLLLLFYYYHYYKAVATDKPLRASLFPGAAELKTHLLRLINILWLPLCRINKFGFYFIRRLLRSPILVGHQWRSSR
jgi:hypothetical protein